MSRRALFKESFVKKQRVLEALPIRPPQGRSKVGSGRPATEESRKKHVFFKKARFFHKTRVRLPRGRRPLRVPLMMPLSMRALSKRINFCKLHTFSFFGTVSVTIAQEGPPNEFFSTFFGRVFGRARVQISNAPLLRSVFFAT